MLLEISETCELEFWNYHNPLFKYIALLQLLLYGDKDIPDVVNRIILQWTVDFIHKIGQLGQGNLDFACAMKSLKSHLYLPAICSDHFCLAIHNCTFSL